MAFNRLTSGEAYFFTYGLVDGRIVAREFDEFGEPDTGVVPLPATAWMMIAGFGAMGAMRRRRKAA